MFDQIEAYISDNKLLVAIQELLDFCENTIMFDRVVRISEELSKLENSTKNYTTYALEAKREQIKISLFNICDELKRFGLPSFSIDHSLKKGKTDPVEQKNEENAGKPTDIPDIIKDDFFVD